jgi:RNA polymerase sigma factor (TIGR02999 family)
MIAMTAPSEPGTPKDLTRFLDDLAHGDADAAATLMPHVYGELKAIAEGYMIRQRADHTLQPTALVNEAYVKLFDRSVIDWKDRGHFYALAARAMRQLLVDHARARRRKKRGGGRREVTLDEAVAKAAGIEVDLLALDEALRELAELDPRQAQVVELRYFGGLEVAQVAQMLEVSVTTVEREWRSARAWLGSRLGEADAAATGESSRDPGQPGPGPT